ncbi:class II aldolase/adducin family protein [Mycolicibacterium smegmatis]|uniref:L-fuculose phosphate aldolase n=1 Tax=Mycolicibacterium smegmatis (strain MKD8) TaxID=1214915 RepID=A0A2U9PP68_MYCSE|nr:class II aldolase/adducin family protein [Mycolicibacterium smegmatis]AWT53560.1 L-fuculose phosphate aldolase [Mycolicibacterium smegmatis MKD8]
MIDLDVKEAALTVATSCRILAQQGLAADVLGHVSMRLDAERILLRCRGPHDRGLLFTEVDDICVVRLDGGAELPDGYAVPNEMHIHTEILRARPDVRAVVHVHPREVMVADLAGVVLPPVFGAYNIPAARLAVAGVPVYPRSVLIRTPELGAAVAATMREADVCMLRGHGIATAGDSVEQATMRALDLTELARVAGEIVRLGAEPRPVPDVAELPDLGAAFNDESRWRHHTGRLELAGLAL